ncbi:unnamed protein product [Meganyctiphanes norvegica]|uniref:OCIA domain-containing protein n=1 Tax=Meganyctiphanes norvegica TaxID=48144 RepID=A0AAV2Q0J0_MEGNR
MDNNPPPQQGYPPQQQQQQQQSQRPVFNSEELRVLRECNKESFYYRCLPFAFVGSSAAYMAIRTGYLNQSSRFGFAPKMMGAALVGYFVGKMSYQNACAEKLMRLPNSPVGEALRKRKGQVGFQESLSIEPGFKMDEKWEGSPTQQPIFDDHRPDLRDRQEGLDDYNRITESLAPYTETDTAAAPQHYTSYEELRRQNREEYNKRMDDRYRRPQGGLNDLPSAPSGSDPAGGSPYIPPPVPEGPPPSYGAPPSPAYQPSTSPSPGMRKNKYGDDVYG